MNDVPFQRIFSCSYNDKQTRSLEASLSSVKAFFKPFVKKETASVNAKFENECA